MSAARLCKRLLRGVACIAVTPCVAACRLSGLFLGRQRAFAGWSQLFALLPGVCGCYLRWAFYRWTLARCGRDGEIGFGTIFSRDTAEIEDGAYIGAYCVLGDVIVRRNALIASGVSIPSGRRQHPLDPAGGDRKHADQVHERIVIGENAWIGERAVVMASVGKDGVIGAGAVVVEPIPEKSVAVGVPARVIRTAPQDWPPEADRADSVRGDAGPDA
ncbi:MAG: acyltransferase [Thermogutta sp.]|nr:acyltransferase [Thermogutta sp.]